VAEYWLIDPQRQRAEFYQLGADGRYVAVAPDAEGIYHAAVMPGFWLRVAWLWQEPLPPVLSLLRELHVL
jgi:Uma2 family endonuclease